MQFSVNHPILFLLVGIIVLAVLGQSVFFLVRAWRRGKQIGLDPAKLRRIAVTLLKSTRQKRTSSGE